MFFFSCQIIINTNIFWPDLNSTIWCWSIFFFLHFIVLFFFSLSLVSSSSSFHIKLVLYFSLLMCSTSSSSTTSYCIIVYLCFVVFFCSFEKVTHYTYIHIYIYIWNMILCAEKIFHGILIEIRNEKKKQTFYFSVFF